MYRFLKTGTVCSVISSPGLLSISMQTKNTEHLAMFNERAVHITEKHEIVHL